MVSRVKRYFLEIKDFSSPVKLNIPYNFNITYNIINSNSDLSGENLNDLSGEQILNQNNIDLSNNTDLPNNTDLSNNIYNNQIFNRIENEIVNTLTNLYYRRQEERDLEIALMNSLQDN